MSEEEWEELLGLLRFEISHMLVSLNCPQSPIRREQTRDKMRRYERILFELNTMRGK